MEKGLLLLPVAQDQQFLKLVEDQVDRAQAVRIKRIHRFGRGSAGGDGIQRGVPQRLIQRAVDIVPPADIDIEPVRRVEAVGQAAADQAGLAAARLTINQHQAALVGHLVKLLNLIFPPEEALAVGLFVGIEKFERGMLH